MIEELTTWTRGSSLPINRWFWGYCGLDVYVRYYNDRLTIANVNAKVQGHGSFTRFLGACEREFDVIVENVINERLEQFLLRRGYHRIENRDYPPYDYKLLRHS